MLQIIKAVLKETEDTTRISLLFANQTEEDILVRSELELLAKQHRNFSLWYTLDRPPKSMRTCMIFLGLAMACVVLSYLHACVNECRSEGDSGMGTSLRNETPSQGTSHLPKHYTWLGASFNYKESPLPELFLVD